MKTLILLVLTIAALDGFAQDWMSSLNQYAQREGERELNCWVSGVHSRGISKQIAQEAQQLSDLCAHYPESWFKSYRSTKLVVTKGGKTKEAVGTSNQLTTAQKALLKGVDLNATVRIIIEYTQSNIITKAIENRTMDIGFSVVPDEKAQFIEGDLMHYLKEQITSALKKADLEPFDQFNARFMIDENGRVEHVNHVETSQNKAVDALLIKIIKNMPLWKPAQNKNGKKVKQEFDLYAGFWMKGC